MTNKGASIMMTNYNAFAAAATDAASAVISAADINFYAGTMFAVCSAHDAAKIETTLIEALKCGVIVSKVGPEFAFDFTA
jgi:hypothetical protein